ncbi:putative GNAT superfamily acetyltransferase [Williamsia limnetica]|uniref:Putative GNAT superfamily acetyltransferase n=1 Tax=Williamsia limnetica TaxID=882452 RepID=A0A318RAV6_WILLI|nr:GNAT family N-acetyltransferase [Williamsia limnetica]PYE12126.1 putative GNAT superfamily acetyltransferase [Williamsia limnetica]
MTVKSYPEPAPGLTLRMLESNDDIVSLVGLFDQIWRPDPGNRPVSTDMVRALIHAGNYVSGAYLDDVLVGGSVAFFAAPAGRVLHSHITGVGDRGRGRSVGFALKLHQRDWALAQGLSEITWTFDPLVARNAHFNLAKLGAAPVAYHVDFYGDVGDEIGGGDESDRLLVSWSLGDLRSPAAPDAGSVSDAVTAIDTSDPADPRATIGDLGDAEVVLVPVPHDIEAMRRDDPAAASRWRIALREAMSELVGEGGRRVAFDRSGHYVFTTAKRS